MLRRYGPAALVAALCAAALPAAPGAIPATLKTLESILKGVDLPADGAGGGMRPLTAAVAGADALLRSFDPGGFSAARQKAPETPAGAETGLQLARHGGAVVVGGVIPGSPADVSGLQEGDRLLEIGDREVLPRHRLDEIQGWLRGDGSEKVTVRALRADQRNTVKAELARGPIEGGVRARVLDGRVGYVRVTELTPVVLAEYRLRVGKLAAEDLIGIVLDLRNTRGGDAADAQILCQPFSAGLAIGQRRKPGADAEAFRTGPGATLSQRLVVLVGPGTSGAAEIAAGAFQAAKRAVLLGAKTQGRATAYRRFQQAGVFLTVPESLFALPGGAVLTGRGLTPDITVDALPYAKSVAENLAGQREAFTKGEKWVPPKKETETDRDLSEALGSEDGEAPKDAQSDEDSDTEEPAEEDDEELTGPRDPFHDYVLVKSFDPRLVRAVHLLMAADIFFFQTR